MNLKKNSR